MMSDWQPIETAPKDGTAILLGRVADLDEDDQPRPGVVAQGYWQEGCDDGPDVMGYDACWTDSDYTVFSFPRSFGAEAYRTRGYQPTHWMPLPAPPQGASVGSRTPKAAAAGEASGCLTPFPDELRQTMGEALTECLLDGAETPDWNDSREVDRIIDCVQACVEGWQEERAASQPTSGGQHG